MGHRKSDRDRLRRKISPSVAPKDILLLPSIWSSWWGKSTATKYTIQWINVGLGQVGTPRCLSGTGESLTLSLAGLCVRCIILHRVQCSGAGSGEPSRGTLMGHDTGSAVPLMNVLSMRLSWRGGAHSWAGLCRVVTASAWKYTPKTAPPPWLGESLCRPGSQ